MGKPAEATRSPIEGGGGNCTSCQTTINHTKRTAELIRGYNGEGDDSWDLLRLNDRRAIINLHCTWIRSALHMESQCTAPPLLCCSNDDGGKEEKGNRGWPAREKPWHLARRREIGAEELDPLRGGGSGLKVEERGRG